jgi:hypothetical protein
MFTQLKNCLMLILHYVLPVLVPTPRESLFISFTHQKQNSRANVCRRVCYFYVRARFAIKMNLFNCIRFHYELKRVYQGENKFSMIPLIFFFEYLSCAGARATHFLPRSNWVYVVSWKFHWQSEMYLKLKWKLWPSQTSLVNFRFS